MHEELRRVRAWAEDRLASGQEPPWAWYQYMKLRETLDVLLAGMDANAVETPRRPIERQTGHLRLVDAIDL